MNLTLFLKVLTCCSGNGKYVVTGISVRRKYFKIFVYDFALERDSISRKMNKACDV
jgi:hypothetical protein